MHPMVPKVFTCSFVIIGKIENLFCLCNIYNTEFTYTDTQRDIWAVKMHLFGLRTRVGNLKPKFLTRLLKSGQP